MGALKDIYSPVFYNKLTRALTQVLPKFDEAKFHSLIFKNGFEQMELKERMRHTTLVMHQFLPVHYPDVVQIIYQLIGVLRQKGQGNDAWHISFYLITLKSMD